jgi:hypothetical protein
MKKGLPVALLLLITLTSLWAQKVENLGNQVNSEFNEINPMISPDGKTLYFARVSHPQNTFGDKGSQDIWMSELDVASNKWGPARRLAFPLNSDEYNCAYSITPDGNTMLIKGAYNNGKYETRGYSFSKKTANGWSVPQKLVIANFDRMSQGQYDCGFLSADGKVLIMSFSEKKNSKEDDLYVSFRMKDGSWSKPITLGPDVNTKFTETTPFLAADGVGRVAMTYMIASALIKPGNAGRSHKTWVLRLTRMGTMPTIPCRQPAIMPT